MKVTVVRDPDKRLFTYSSAQATAARANAGKRVADLQFVTRPVDAPASVGIGELSLRDLTDFWENPSKFFCRRVLRLSLEGSGSDGADDELFGVDAMTEGLVKSRMLSASLAGTRDSTRELRRFLADGSLPPGEIGASWYNALSTKVAAVLALIPQDIPARSAIIEIERDGWRMKGRLDGIRGDVRFMVRAGNLRAEHRIKAWVEHVAMCAARESGIAGLPSTTVLMGKEGMKGAERIGPVPKALDALASLVTGLLAGHTSPAPFFPQAGWAWFAASRSAPKKKGGKKSEPKDPVAMAKAAFEKESTPWSSMGGDNEDPYIALSFRGDDPMESRYAEFERLTSVLFNAWPSAGDIE